jgi:hypothetical protein
MQYPEHFIDFLAFLHKKYGVSTERVYINYQPEREIHDELDGQKYYRAGDFSKHYSPKGEFTGRYMLSVYKGGEPLLILAHEFAHMVHDIKTRGAGTAKGFRPPDDPLEKAFDRQAWDDWLEFLIHGPN